MIPSKTEARILGVDDDKTEPTHDALSAWLLRAVRVQGFPERLLASVPGAKARAYEGVELEVPVSRNTRLIGFADARLFFADGVRLWIEIKTDDLAIGALVRQIKTYRHAGATGYWLAVMPEASEGAREFLAHAGVGLYLAPKVSADLVSISARRREALATAAGRFAEIPEVL